MNYDIASYCHGHNISQKSFCFSIILVLDKDMYLALYYVNTPGIFNYFGDITFCFVFIYILTEGIADCFFVIALQNFVVFCQILPQLTPHTYLKAFTATTTGTPNILAFSICFFKLLKPFPTSSRSCRNNRGRSGRLESRS